MRILRKISPELNLFKERFFVFQTSPKAPQEKSEKQDLNQEVQNISDKFLTTVISDNSLNKKTAPLQSAIAALEKKFKNSRGNFEVNGRNKNLIPVFKNAVDLYAYISENEDKLKTLNNTLVSKVISKINESNLTDEDVATFRAETIKSQKVEVKGSAQSARKKLQQSLPSIPNPRGGTLPQPEGFELNPYTPITQRVNILNQNLTSLDLKPNKLDRNVVAVMKDLLLKVSAISDEGQIFMDVIPANNLNQFVTALETTLKWLQKNTLNNEQAKNLVQALKSTPTLDKHQLNNIARNLSNFNKNLKETTTTETKAKAKETKTAAPKKISIPASSAPETSTNAAKESLNEKESKFFSPAKVDEKGNSYYEYQGTKTEDPSLGKIFKQNKDRNTLWIVKESKDGNPVYVKIERKGAGSEYYASGSGKRAYERKYGKGRIVIQKPENNNGKAVRIYLEEPQIKLKKLDTTSPNFTPEKQENYNELLTKWAKSADTTQTQAAEIRKQNTELQSLNIEKIYDEKQSLDKSISAMTEKDWKENYFNIDGLNRVVNLLTQAPFTARSHLGLQKFLIGKKDVSIADLDKKFTRINTFIYNKKGEKVALSGSAGEIAKKTKEAIKNVNDPKLRKEMENGALMEVKKAVLQLKEIRTAVANMELKLPGMRASYDVLFDKIDSKDRLHKVDFSKDIPYSQENLASTLPSGTIIPDEFRKNGLVLTGNAKKIIEANFKGVDEKLITSLLLQFYTPDELSEQKNNGKWCLKTTAREVYDDNGKAKLEKAKIFALDNLPADFIKNAQKITEALKNKKEKITKKEDLYELITTFGSTERKLEAHLAYIVDPNHEGSKEFNKDSRLNWAKVLERTKAEFTNQLQTTTAERAAYLRIFERVKHIENPAERVEALRVQLNEMLRRGVFYLRANLKQEQRENVYKLFEIKDLTKPFSKEDREYKPYGIRDYLRAGYIIDNEIREAKQRLEKTAEKKNTPAGKIALQAQIEGVLKAHGAELKPEAKKQIVEALWDKISHGIGIQAVANGGYGAGYGFNIPVRIGNETINVFAGIKFDSQTMQKAAANPFALASMVDAGVQKTVPILKNIELNLSASLWARTVGVNFKLPSAINLNINVSEIGGGSAFAVSGGIGFRMEDIIEEQKINNLKSQNLHEIYQLMSKNPSDEVKNKAYDEIMKVPALKTEVNKYIQLAEKKANKTLSKEERVALAWKVASLSLAAEKSQKNPQLKDYIKQETDKLEKEFKAKGLTLDENAKKAFALKLSQAYITLKANETVPTAKLPPITGIGVAFVMPPGIPIPYIGIVTGRKTVVVPFVSSDIDRKDLLPKLQEQLNKEGNVTYEVSKEIDLGSTKNLTRDVLSGRLKLSDKDKLKTYSALSAETIFDSTKGYNEKLKPVGVQLLESANEKYTGLLEIKVSRPGERLTIHLDNDIQDKVRVVYEGNRAFLAIKQGTPLFINREDLSYSFKKDGAYTHTEITIKSNPYVKNSTIRNNPQGFYLSKRTRVVHEGGSMSGAIKHEDWTERAYRGKEAKGNAAIMGLQEYQIEDTKPSYRAERLNMNDYKLAAKQLQDAIVSKEKTGNLNDKEIKALMDFADKVAVNPAFKNLSTSPYSTRLSQTKAMKGVEVNLGELTKTINTLSLAVTPPIVLDNQKMQIVLMRLMNKSFMNLQQIKNPAEKEARFKVTLETFTKPLLNYIFQQRMKEMGYDSSMSNILANKMVDSILKKGLDLNAQGEVIPYGTLFASMVGTRNTDGRYVTGLRFSENMGPQLGLKPGEVGANALKLLNKTSFRLNQGSSNEKAVARIILATLSPVPKENFKLTQSPLALKLAPFIGFAMGAENMARLTKIMSAKNEGELKNLLTDSNNKSVFNSFAKYVQEARTRQLAGGEQAKWKLAIPNIRGAVLEIDLSKVNVAAGLYKRCGNLTFVANEEISATLKLNRKLYAGGARNRYETYVRAKLATELKVLGIAVMVGALDTPQGNSVTDRGPNTNQTPDTKVPDRQGPTPTPQPKDNNPRPNNNLFR